NCSRNHDLYSTFIKSDAYIDGSNPPVRRLSSSSQPLQKSKISSSKNSSGSCNSVIRGCDTNACDIPSVHTKGVFKAVDPNCTHICVAQRDFNFIGDCPLTHCDYECAAQRFANRTTVVFLFVQKGITVTRPQDKSEHAPIADPLLCRTMGGESVAGCPQRMEGGTGDDQCPQRMEGGTGDDQCPQRMEGGTGDDQCPQRMEGGT
ncbi:hypothetical protein MAR_031015, partial [Mya arenaria]